MSAFFHGRGRRPHPDGDPSVDQLVDELVDGRWARPPVRWFDREFAPALGVDVYDHPFDPDTGSAVVETPAVRVLLLRQENLAAAPAALARFLGRPGPVPVPPRNEASTKGYGPRYAEFLATARLPERLLDQAYGSRYARHFYADTELEGFRRRWSGGGGSARSD